MTPSNTHAVDLQTELANRLLNSHIDTNRITSWDQGNLADIPSLREWNGWVQGYAVLALASIRLHSCFTTYIAHQVQCYMYHPCVCMDVWVWLVNAILPLIIQMVKMFLQYTCVVLLYTLCIMLPPSSCNTTDNTEHQCVHSLPFTYPIGGSKSTYS